MSKENNKSIDKKMWRTQVWWVPIVVAVIGLVGVLIATFAKPNNNTPTPVPNLTTSFSYTVQVQDANSGESISNAKVTLAVTSQVPSDEITDGKGIAVIDIDRDKDGETSRVTVEAKGYKPYSQYITLQANKLPDIILLEPE